MRLVRSQFAAFFLGLYNLLITEAALTHVQASQLVIHGDSQTPSSSEPREYRSGNATDGYFINERIPSIPLIVKSPYLQSWLPVGSGQPQLAGKWCQFWTGQRQGWTGFIRVDGHAYTFMGDPSLYGQSIATQTFYKVCCLY